MLQKISRENKPIILAGDTNFDLLKLSEDKNIQEFYDLITEYHIQPTILEPTRIVHGNRPTIVDNIFTNTTNKNITSGNLLSKLSDHMPNFSFFINLSVSIRKNSRIVRNYKCLDVV